VAPGSGLSSIAANCKAFWLGTNLEGISRMSKTIANRVQSQRDAHSKNQPKSTATAAPTIATNGRRRKTVTPGLAVLGAVEVGGAGGLAVAGIVGYKVGWFDPAPTAPGTAATPGAILATGKPLPPVTLPADYQNALRAADEIVSHYTRELNSPSTVIHSVR